MNELRWALRRASMSLMALHMRQLDRNDLADELDAAEQSLESAEVLEFKAEIQGMLAFLFAVISGGALVKAAQLLGAQ